MTQDYESCLSEVCTFLGAGVASNAVLSSKNWHLVTRPNSSSPLLATPSRPAPLGVHKTKHYAESDTKLVGPGKKTLLF